MNRNLLISSILLMVASIAWAQSQIPPGGTAPIYTVTVVDRTVSAVDYQYRNGPTQIDFRGTVLLPGAGGGAIVESKTGRTEIDAHFDHLPAPTRYGPEYLTYVLWALTPDGHARNLGEVLPGHADKANLRVTTDLQAFGMIVTAEPYAAVRRPSSVVVMENEPRPDTIGNREPIQAKYELLNRVPYTYNVQAGEAIAAAPGPSVSMSQYQSLVEIYEAQNAVNMAQSADAARFAPDVFAKAQGQLQDARTAYYSKAGMTTVVTLAREAAQTAEDARTLATERRRNDELAKAKEQAAQAEALRTQAEAAAQTAQTQAAAAQALLDQERAARQQAEAQAQAAMATPPPPPPPPAQVTYVAPPPDAAAESKKQVRFQLLEQCNASLPARDTPRGVTVTLADSDFRGASVSPSVDDRLAAVASVLRRYPGLTVEVDGNEAYSSERAEAVREILIQDGVPDSAIVARGLGDSRPIASNATAAGRQENQRVEIIVSGDLIGDMPYWAKSYTLIPSR